MGFSGCLAALPGNRPFLALSALFSTFLLFCGGSEEHQENLENVRKRPFSSDILESP